MSPETLTSTPESHTTLHLGRGFNIEFRDSQLELDNFGCRFAVNSFVCLSSEVFLSSKDHDSRRLWKPVHQDQLKYRGNDAEGEKDSPAMSDILHTGTDSGRDNLAEWNEERAEVNRRI